MKTHNLLVKEPEATALDPALEVEAAARFDAYSAAVAELARLKAQVEAHAAERVAKLKAGASDADLDAHEAEGVKLARAVERLAAREPALLADVYAACDKFEAAERERRVAFLSEWGQSRVTVERAQEFLADLEIRASIAPSCIAGRLASQWRLPPRASVAPAPAPAPEFKGIPGRGLAPSEPAPISTERFLPPPSHNRLTRALENAANEARSGAFAAQLTTALADATANPPAVNPPGVNV